MIIIMVGAAIVAGIKPFWREVAFEPRIHKEEKLDLVVKKGFSKRRKTIKNALKGMISEDILIKHGIDPIQRPEDISILKWSKLSNVVNNNEE